MFYVLGSLDYDFFDGLKPLGTLDWHSLDGRRSSDTLECFSGNTGLLQWQHGTREPIFLDGPCQ